MPYAILTVFYEPRGEEEAADNSNITYTINGITPRERDVWDFAFTNQEFCGYGTTMGKRTKLAPDMLNTLESMGYTVVSYTCSHNVSQTDHRSSSRDDVNDVYIWTLIKTASEEGSSVLTSLTSGESELSELTPSEGQPSDEGQQVDEGHPSDDVSDEEEETTIAELVAAINQSYLLPDQAPSSETPEPGCSYSKPK